MGHAATLRDHETGAHNLRVAYMDSLFGQAWGLDRLTDDEVAVMQQHPVLGALLEQRRNQIFGS